MDCEAKAERQCCKDTARVVGLVVPLLVLLWIVHMGYKLTTESMDVEIGDSEGSYISLVFGVVTVVIGLIYFVVGLTIVAEKGEEDHISDLHTSYSNHGLNVHADVGNILWV
ncbi:hypothetical protein RDABS01_006484 [Bienertia sinuspersici]